MVTTTQLDVRPMTGAIGAEIFGVDLGADLDDATIAAIRRALLDHCVVFFRDQDITDDEQVRFATRSAACSARCSATHPMSPPTSP